MAARSGEQIHQAPYIRFKPRGGTPLAALTKRVKKTNRKVAALIHCLGDETLARLGKMMTRLAAHD
jgi:hypothetical protein